MKTRTAVILIAGSLLIIIGNVGGLIWSERKADLFDFISGTGAGTVFAAAIWYLLERKKVIRTDGVKDWPTGSKRLLFLVFGGLALVFLVFFLIFDF